MESILFTSVLTKGWNAIFFVLVDRPGISTTSKPLATSKPILIVKLHCTFLQQKWLFLKMQLIILKIKTCPCMGIGTRTTQL